MKNSVRTKVTVVMTVILLFVIVICWILNATLLEDFYQHTKISTLDVAYNDINDILGMERIENELVDDVSINISRISTTNNISTYILIPKNNMYYFIYPTLQDILSIRSLEHERVKAALKRYLYGNVQLDGIELITNNSHYEIYKYYDEQIESYYIDLVGYLDNGCILFIRTNLESIQESVEISNRFLIYTGFVALFVGAFIMLYFSKTITKPVNELAYIAMQMTNLDFDIKYQNNRNDEIGNLGNSINQLSNKLEITISELKNANAKLNSDIQEKNQIEEMRKEFLSNVSHELKTPIALIQGYAEGLLENINDDPENQQFYCEVIIDEASKMNKLVKQLLSLSQFESNSNQISITRFDIVELITSIINNNELFVNQKNVKVYFDDYEPTYVWADEYMIEEVLTNYFSNALNHVYENGIIEIKLIYLHNLLRVAVFNTGDNIPQNDIDHVFDKFYKVDKARTREYGGNGIGLSIVKAIMNKHDKAFGVINRESGVEFFFELDTKN